MYIVHICIYTVCMYNIHTVYIYIQYVCKVYIYVHIQYVCTVYIYVHIQYVCTVYIHVHIWWETEWACVRLVCQVELQVTFSSTHVSSYCISKNSSPAISGGFYSGSTSNYHEHNAHCRRGADCSKGVDAGTVECGFNVNGVCA